jgi:hypothetical protein
MNKIQLGRGLPHWIRVHVQIAMLLGPGPTNIFIFSNCGYNIMGHVVA